MASQHDCSDCGTPVTPGAEVFLGFGPELRAFHQGCFEHPRVPEQRLPVDESEKVEA